MKADHHIHMVLDGADWRGAIGRHSTKPDIPWIRTQLDIYRAAGYTYLRDGGDRWGVGAAARSLAPEYGITYRTPLAPLCKAGHYGSFIGLTYENTHEYADLVKQHRANGADFIKIMISGLMDFDRYRVLSEPGLPAPLIRELIHIAHEEGFAVMAHANGPRTVEAAAVAGVDSVEHGAYLDTDALCAMKENGTVWVPT
jgi:imidazolonepropionase-like amidohydrolase